MVPSSLPLWRARDTAIAGGSYVGEAAHLLLSPEAARPECPPRNHRPLPFLSATPSGHPWGADNDLTQEGNRSGANDSASRGAPDRDPRRERGRYGLDRRNGLP